MALYNLTVEKLSKMLKNKEELKYLKKWLEHDEVLNQIDDLQGGTRRADTESVRSAQIERVEKLTPKSSRKEVRAERKKQDDELERVFLSLIRSASSLDAGSKTEDAGSQPTIGSAKTISPDSQTGNGSSNTEKSNPQTQPQKDTRNNYDDGGNFGI